MTIKPEKGKLWSKVNIDKPEGLVAEHILKDVEIAGIVGEIVIPTEEVANVELDFTNGDMAVTPSEGSVFSVVNISKPEGLVASNIASGVNIAGIVGEFEGGGGGGEGFDFDTSDENLKYFAYSIDKATRSVVIKGILYSEIYKETGSYDVVVPDTLGGYAVVIDASGVK